MALRGLADRLRRIDWVLLGATLLLIAVGLAALYSVTLNVEQPRIDKFYRQLVSFGIGLVVLLAVLTFDYRFLRSYSWFIYGAGLLMLLALFVAGITIRGTTGWFSILGRTFQPVELVKVILVIALARFLADNLDDSGSWRVIRLSGLIVVIPAALVLWQRDLGSALILIAGWLGLLLFLRIPLRRLGLILLGFGVVAGLSWFVLKDYQRERILTFLDPGRDPLRSGYNIRQAIVAIGSGKLFGRGLGLGTQSQLNFLPTQDTDFIFAVVAEELGLFGVLLLLFLFAVFLLRLIRQIDETRDAFGSLLLAGLLVLFAVEIIVNIGGNVGLLPITGTPLPFLSFGGSALISSMFAVGIVLSVHLRSSGK